MIDQGELRTDFSGKCRVLGVLFLYLTCVLQDIIYFTFKRLGCDIIRPFMRYKEIVIVNELLRKKRPKLCLEWGAGYSTFYFSKYIANDAKWFAIEHDRIWFNKLKRLTSKHSRISIYYNPPNRFPWTDLHGDGSYLDLIDYLTFPNKFDEKYDLILVDGRGRKYCLMEAFKLLKDDGVVILHDANRKYYYEPFMLYDYQLLFRDSRKNEGGIWIGSKRPLPSNVLDITKHKLNWELFNRSLDNIEVWLKRRIYARALNGGVFEIS